MECDGAACDQPAGSSQEVWPTEEGAAGTGASCTSTARGASAASAASAITKAKATKEQISSFRRERFCGERGRSAP